MKFCAKCGTQLEDNAVFCTYCGEPTEKKVEAEAPYVATVVTNQKKERTLQTVAKIFMLIAVISCGLIALFAGSSIGLLSSLAATLSQEEAAFFNMGMGILGGSLTFSCLLPLAWCIPMTVHYWKKAKKGEDVSTGFKVCTLLFVGLIPGILMLCDKEDK